MARLKVFGRLIEWNSCSIEKIYNGSLMNNKVIYGYFFMIRFTFIAGNIQDADIGDGCSWIHWYSYMGIVDETRKHRCSN